LQHLLIRRIHAKLLSNSAFMSSAVLDRVRGWKSRPKLRLVVELIAECMIKFRGEKPEFFKIFLAIWERFHWVVDSSVILGLHPDLNPGRSVEELALALKLWMGYSHDRKRRGDALRAILTEFFRLLYEASKNEDSAGAAPTLDAELCFDPSVPFAPPDNLPWLPASADWCAASAEIDRKEPWRVWWLRQPALHPFNQCFLPLHPEFDVFAPADFDSEYIQSQIQEDLDPDEPAPPLVSSTAPAPANRDGLAIFGDESRVTTL